VQCRLILRDVVPRKGAPVQRPVVVLPQHRLDAIEAIAQALIGWTAWHQELTAPRHPTAATGRPSRARAGG
jgi:hypothetical protein